MHSRRVVALVAALLFLAAVSSAAPAFATSSVATAQTGETGEQEGEGGQGQGEGQDDPDAETGASEEESEGGATETGPPWTYQMARITLIGSAFLLLACGYLYWRLVVRRRRGEA
jgi:cobalamin biosynthesis Mg chelatase CobN